MTNAQRLLLALRLTLGAAILLGILLISAGRFDAWQPWAYCGVIWLIATGTYTHLGRTSPGLVAERMRPPSDTDRATRRLVALPFLTYLITSGLDLRFGWSALPSWLTALSLIIVAAGFGLVTWVLSSNPFASSAVRIQQERGHSVISSGPYRLVRHPMYLAVVLVCLASGPALGSWYSGLALVPVVLIFIRRTLREDRLLHEQLAGYADYASRVRWRVVPLVF